MRATMKIPGNPFAILFFIPNRPLTHILLIVFLLVVSTLSLSLNTQANKGKRSAQQVITLQTFRSPIDIGGPVSALVTSPNEDETIYMINGLTGEVQSYSNATYRTFTYTNGPLAIRSSEHIAYIDKNSKVALAEPKGKVLGRIDTLPAISLATLSNGNIVIASPTHRYFLHLYNPNGQLLKDFGKLKKYKSLDHAQNLFMHKGKLIVDAFDNIYYVYHYLPLIQMYSPAGELEREIIVQGGAIDLQQELAQRFLRSRGSNMVGGITIINSAAIDRKTGHLWIGLNGSSTTGTVYEYGINGEKLREYILEVVSAPVNSEVITGVIDIAISGSKLYALSSQYQVFEFERNVSLGLHVTNKPSNIIQKEGHSIKPVAWISSVGKPVWAIQGSCGTGQPWNSCAFTCPGPVCQGSPPAPTPTSSNSADLDCKAALMETLAPGYVVISSPCTTYPAGTQMHMRGGCMAAVTICRDGVNSNHNLTLDCIAPDCSGGGGGEWCQWQPCDIGVWDPLACACDPSPILIDTSGNGFSLTDLNNGVRFDLNNDNTAERLSWTAAGSDDAWLALDRNGNGFIDNGQELFGSTTPQPVSTLPHGFIALAEFDKSVNGGNGDGKISSNDMVFSLLRLWRDSNHNGISEPNELFTLPALDVHSIDLEYKLSRRRDQYGNDFRIRAKIYSENGGHLGRWAYDVFLTAEQ